MNANSLNRAFCVVFTPEEVLCDEAIRAMKTSGECQGMRVEEDWEMLSGGLVLFFSGYPLRREKKLDLAGNDGIEIAEEQTERKRG